jgi:hypothetical protein
MIYFFTGSDNKREALDEGDRRLEDRDGRIGDCDDLDPNAPLHPARRVTSRRRGAVKRRAMFVGVTDYRDVRG